MKLQAQEIHRIIDRVVKDWREQKLAHFQVNEDQMKLKLSEIFIKELKVEDDLNAEVEKILGKYEKEFEKGALDRRKMFLMVKNQLVKERKIVL